MEEPDPAAPAAVSWLRQGRYFVAIGILQWLLDWVVMVLLSHAGLRLAFANVTGRVTGALLGFWLDGSITFSRDGSRPKWRHFARYLILWLANAALSTLSLVAIGNVFGLHGAWLAKPAIDGMLALSSFLASRYWVYR